MTFRSKTIWTSASRRSGPRFRSSRSRGIQRQIGTAGLQYKSGRQTTSATERGSNSTNTSGSPARLELPPTIRLLLGPVGQLAGTSSGNRIRVFAYTSDRSARGRQTALQSHRMESAFGSSTPYSLRICITIIIQEASAVERFVVNVPGWKVSLV